MGITFDISERRANDEALRILSGRLIGAQEQERKRIARELHDGIGQQIAMIAIGLSQLQSTTDPQLARHHKAIKKLAKDTRNLASDVKTLSHELHSSAWSTSDWSRRSGVYAGKSASVGKWRYSSRKAMCRVACLPMWRLRSFV
jgi:hypothetical protein